MSAEPRPRASCVNDPPDHLPGDSAAPKRKTHFSFFRLHRVRGHSNAHSHEGKNARPNRTESPDYGSNTNDDGRKRKNRSDPAEDCLHRGRHPLGGIIPDSRTMPRPFKSHSAMSAPPRASIAAIAPPESPPTPVHEVTSAATHAAPDPANRPLTRMLVANSSSQIEVCKRVCVTPPCRTVRGGRGLSSP